MRISQIDLAPSNRLYGALPTDPYEGQEIVYQNATMATQSVMWRLRYWSGNSALVAKWVFLGGSRLIAGASGGSGVVTSGGVGTFVTMPNGPQLTLPLSGTYDVYWQFDIQMTTAGGDGRVGVARNAAPTVLLSGLAWLSDSAVFEGISTSRQEKVGGNVAGDILKLSFASNVNVAFNQLGTTHLSVVPALVGP